MEKSIFGNIVGTAIPPAYVSYDQTMDLTVDQQKVARENIGAATEDQVASKLDKLTTNQVVYARGTAAAPGDKGITYTTSPSGSTLVYRDGGGQFNMKDPTKADHGATKNYVDTNFIAKEATSQTITGNLILTGDFTVKGTTKTQDNETIRIADNIIELNSEKQDNLTTLSGLAINKDETSTYGVMYDPTDDTVKFGEGSTTDGVFTFGEGEGAPIAVRDDSSKLADGAIMIFKKYDENGKEVNKLVNSGYTIDTLKQWVRDYVESYMSTTITVDTDGGEIIEMTVADNLISEKDGILEIGG
jgi:hypothetical protein